MPLPKSIVNFIAAITPPCHEVTRLVSQNVEKPLSLKTRIKLRLHYLICLCCRRYAKQIQYLHRAIDGIPERSHLIFDDKLSESARRELKEKIRSQLGK